jgi:hypothetical protein
MHKHYFKLKTWLLVFLMVITSISISVIAVVYEFNQDIKIVRAGAGDIISGYAWSSNIGWISFNCDNAPSTCGSVDYGVNIDSTTGNFSGYAWSSNVGWIDFAPAGPYPKVPSNQANYSTTTRALTGWAKILTLGADGWLKFDNAAVGADGLFTGWMWNANDTGSGIGWVSLNSLNSGAGLGSVYSVALKYPGKPVITVVRTIGSTDSSLTITWVDVSGEIRYEVWRDGVQITPDLNQNIISKTDGPLNTGQAYVYIIKACNVFGCTASESVTELTNSVVEVDINSSVFVMTGECPDKVNLTWPETAGADYYKLTRCQDTNCSYVNTNITANTPTTSYEDTTLDGKLKYTYKIEGCNTFPDECGDISAPTKEIMPCPNEPTWHEIKNE